MRILGLDVGAKNVGLAISDPLGMTAQGLPALRRKGNLDRDLEELQAVIDQWEADTLLVGLPKNMNNTLGPSAQMAQDFAGAAGNKSGLPVVFWDERLTSRQAERTMLEGDLSRKKRRQKIDTLAAVLILQNYLDFLATGRDRPNNI